MPAAVGAPSRPAVVHHQAEYLTDHYAVHVSGDARVRLTGALRAFLARCTRERRRAVLMTDPDALLGVFAAAALGDTGGHWVTWDGRGPVIDAVTGAALERYEDLWTGPSATPATPDARLVPSAATTTVVAVDVWAEHRADPSTRIGPLLEEIMGALGGAPRRWGTTEPLAHAWSTDRLTRSLQRQMPESEPVLVGDGEGAHAVLEVSRTTTGLREHVRAAVVVTGSEADAVTRAGDWLAAAAARGRSGARLDVATLSLHRLADRGARTPGPEVPHRLLAAYLGPAALGRSGADAPGLAERHDGTLTGRRRVPGVLVRFQGTTASRQQAYRALVQDVAAAAAGEGEGR